MVSTELRSGRGRDFLNLTHNLLLPTHLGYAVEFFNCNINTVRLYGGDRFAQVFFHPLGDRSQGHVITEPTSTRVIAKQLSPSIQTQGEYVEFTVGDYALKAKQIGVVDTRKDYREEELYERIELRGGQELDPATPYIIQLHPKIEVPTHMGIRLLPIVPYTTMHKEKNPHIREYQRRVMAGWVDSNYKGHVTAHVFYASSLRIKTGDPFAYGQINKFTSPSDRLYGSKALGSHHQHSDGSTRS